MEISQITSRVDFPHYYAERGLVDVEEKIKHLTASIQFPGFSSQGILTPYEKLHELEQYIISVHI